MGWPSRQTCFPTGGRLCIDFVHMDDCEGLFLILFCLSQVRIAVRKRALTASAAATGLLLQLPAPGTLRLELL